MTTFLRMWRIKSRVIRSNDKYLARLEVLKVILNSVDYENRGKDINYALNQEIVISGARELES